jgi:REP element-mobilizing transposase RayT
MQARIYDHRRNLPHLQREDRPLFVTFDSWHRWTFPPIARALALEACRRGDGWKFKLHAAVIMPEHAHLLLTPLGDERGPFSLAEIMFGIKRGSAAAINEALARRGHVWQDEYFDHVLRSVESLNAKAEYIRQNPVRRGIVERPEDYPWLYWCPD